LHVVARAIAPDEGPGVFNGAAVVRERDPFYQQRRSSRGLAQDASLAGLEQHRLQRLAGTDDVRPVAGRHQVIERVGLEIGRQQAREALRGEMDELEEEWRVRRQSET